MSSVRNIFAPINAVGQIGIAVLDRTGLYKDVDEVIEKYTKVRSELENAWSREVLCLAEALYVERFLQEVYLEHNDEDKDCDNCEDREKCEERKEVIPKIWEKVTEYFHSNVKDECDDLMFVTFCNMYNRKISKEINSNILVVLICAELQRYAETVAEAEAQNN